MPDVQPVARRVREHVEDEQVVALREVARIFGQQPDPVRREEHTLGFPAVLPTLLELGCERGAVSVLRSVVGVGHIGRKATGGCVRLGWIDWYRVSPFGGVAQLVEHLHGMQGVVGSIPIASTKRS